MTTLSQDTYAAPGVLLTGVGGEGISTFLTLEAVDATIANLSTVFLSADEAYISSLTTLAIDLDGNILTTAAAGTGSELLLNGIPVATTANISSLADWSLDPAISTVNMNNNNIAAASKITTQNLITPFISTTNINSQGPLTNYTLNLQAANMNLNAQPIQGQQGGLIQLKTLGDATTTAGTIILESIGANGTIGRINLATASSPDPFVPFNSEISMTNSININSRGVANNIAGNILIQSQPDEGREGGVVTLLALGGGPTVGAYSGGTINLIANSGNSPQDVSRIYMSTGFITCEAAADVTQNAANTYVNSAFRTEINVVGDVDENHVNTIQLLADKGARGVIEITAGLGNNDTNFGNVQITAEGGTDCGRLQIFSGGTTNGPFPAGGEIEIQAQAPQQPGEDDDSFISLVANEVRINGQPIGLDELQGVSTYTGGTLTVANITNVSTINGQPYSTGIVSSFNTASVSSLTTSQLVSTRDINLNATRFISETCTGYSNAVTKTITEIGGNAFYTVVAGGGNKGQINLTANPGSAGLYGEVNITANGGTTPEVIATGGLINITANTPVGALPTATSAIKLSAAGVNSYAGAIPSIGSLLGYNFIYGTLGVNLCAGLPPVLPNTAGTTYLYGTSGITLGSQTNTGSDITQSAGGLFTTLVTGYWGGGVASPQNLVIRGRQIPVYGNSYVQLSNVDILSFDSGARKAITGVSTINGAAYPPPQASIPSNLTVSSLTARDSVGTQALTVSSVNGAAYPPPQDSIPANLTVSSLTAAVQVSTLDLFVSSVNGAAYPPPQDSIPANLTVSSLTAAVQVSTPELFISSVNGAAYPPAASVPSNLVVSSLTADETIITFALSSDIINAPVYVCTPQLLVSTLNAGVANISSLTVSSIKEITIGGGVGSAIILEQNPSAPITSYPIIGRAAAAGTVSTQTQHLALLGAQDSTAFIPQFYDTLTGSPSTIGHLGANTLYLGSDTNNWATVRASGNASTIIMSGGLNVSSITASTINGVPFNSSVRQATYYTSTAQTLVSGNTDITFDSAGSWNNDGGYITHVAGTSSFTVVNAGLYQLEFNAVVLANGAVYVLTDQGKQVAIDVTRGTEQSVISNTALQASQQNYSMSVIGTYYLNASDVINLRIRNNFTGGPPTIQAVANTFDLNTFFTWRFIS